MDDAIFPLPELYALALELLPRAARGYAAVAAQLVFALLLGLALRFGVMPLLARAAARNPWPHDDIMVAKLRRGVLPWVLLAGLYASFGDMPWRARSIAWGEKLAATALALSITVALMRGVSEVIGSTRSSEGGGTTLLKYIINSLLLMLGVGVALGVFGVSVFPALTALGVGGLAVALAFQDTLSNVFAGVNISAAGQVRIGDFIALDEKVEGVVTDIGWRMTTLRSLDDLMIFIPNKKLGEAVVTNYNRPDPSMWIELAFRVGLDQDPERVEALVAAALGDARASVEGLGKEAPLIRLRAISADALEFRAFVQIENFNARSPLRHTLLKRVIACLRAEGIELPIPRQALAVDVSAFSHAPGARSGPGGSQAQP